MQTTAIHGRVELLFFADACHVCSLWTGGGRCEHGAFTVESPPRVPHFRRRPCTPPRASLELGASRATQQRPWSGRKEGIAIEEQL